MVADSISDIVRFRLPDDYFQTYADKLRGLRQSDLVQAAETVIDPERLVWVVVGDRAKVEPGIRELNWGDLVLLDPDGNSVKRSSALDSR